LHSGLGVLIDVQRRKTVMADDKRNRSDKPKGGNQGPDRDRKDRQTGGSGTESPGSGGTRMEDEEEAQE
jgi:hypothetical protein